VPSIKDLAEIAGVGIVSILNPLAETCKSISANYLNLGYFISQQVTVSGKRFGKSAKGALDRRSQTSVP